MTEEKNEVIFDDDKISKSEEFVNPDELYQELIQCVQKYHPSDDISMIEKAYKVASEAHKNQFRKSGEPYIIHPLNVAIILADLKLDKETIVAGILHDVVEDTVMTEEDLRREFGDDVALLVDGVTKLEKIPLSGSNGEQSDAKLEMQAENLRKMFLAMAKDIRVIMIKLADRLHNMRTLKYKTPESQQRIAKETLEIYCPIAQRLGISKLKIELDDLSLKYLEPDIYYDLVDKIAVRKSVREKYIQGIVDEVSEHIKNAGIEAKVDGRVKHFFSIFCIGKWSGHSCHTAVISEIIFVKPDRCSICIFERLFRFEGISKHFSVDHSSGKALQELIDIGFQMISVFFFHQFNLHILPVLCCGQTISFLFPCFCSSEIHIALAPYRQMTKVYRFQFYHIHRFCKVKL